MTRTRNPVDWDPLIVWQATVVDLETVRWSLSAAPEPEWIAAFASAPTNKSGSREYVMSPAEPTVADRDIVWKVGPDDHLDANLRIHEKVNAANGAYREALQNRAAESEREAETRRAHDAAIMEAQRKLDEANGSDG
jgi:hypothetical protein